MATIALTLKPFTVPNFVLVETPPGLRQDGAHQLPSIPLRDLPRETLEQLCAQFRESIMQKAGHIIPAANAPLAAWIEQEINRHKD